MSGSDRESAQMSSFDSKKARHKTWVPVLAILLTGSLYFTSIASMKKTAFPMLFGTGFAVVLSESMAPTLLVNDLVIVRQKEEYKPGEIIVYQSQSALIVHRIITMEGSQIITQGDANNAADAPIDVRAI